MVQGLCACAYAALHVNAPPLGSRRRRRRRRWRTVGAVAAAAWRRCCSERTSRRFAAACPSSHATSAQIRALLQNASIEMTCKDTGDLAEAATLVPKGTDIFIALFPNQTWDDLTAAAKAVREAGFNAVPHVPGAPHQGSRRSGRDRAQAHAGGRRHQDAADRRRHARAGRRVRFHHRRARNRRAAPRPASSPSTWPAIPKAIRT